MVLDSDLILEVLALDTTVTGAAQAAVELVVVNLAVWLVAVDIKLGRGKRHGTCRADEASLVVLAGQTPIGG